ncbi:DUF309 domain-containing protein [Streptomyces sp. NPDC054796]
MSEYRPEGGDPACWAGLVCPECGAVRETTDPLAPCPRCGTVPDTDLDMETDTDTDTSPGPAFEAAPGPEAPGPEPGAGPVARPATPSPRTRRRDRDRDQNRSGVRDRDRDPATGRAQNARPRDGLGRPLPYGSPGVARAPEGLVRTPPETLSEAQRLIDTGMPFHAHEVLEDAWKTGPDSERALWRALAQFAVGLTHAARGNTSGATSLLLRAADGLAAFTDDPPHGIDIAALTAWAREAAASPATDLTPPPLRRTE